MKQTINNFILNYKLTLLLFFVGVSVLFLLPSCGCSGYGGYDYLDGTNQYSSVVVIRDSTDTLQTIKYDAKSELVYPTKNISPLLVSSVMPTWLTITTQKKTIRLCLSQKANYAYWVDRKCGEGGSNRTLDVPIIDSITGASAFFVRSQAYGYSYYYYGGSMAIDSLIILP
ncbi:MAG: hypothetical protein CFE21_10680 [Bacteroidetes bacterium B1(2017)]|nr:MAG: hypothetical protein CFE21_10680 [Bacteroidetes bacterium B1(2017)]